MLNSTNIPRTTILWGLVAILVVAGIIALIFSFTTRVSAEDEVAAIYTNAALTLEAQQLTLQAAEPTATETATPTPTDTPTPFVTQTPLTLQPNATLPPSGGGGCDNSVFVSDVTIPDGTVMTPGQAFTKTWRIQNNGTCAWTAAYQLTFVSGNAMGGSSTPVGIAVNPGSSVDISVAMVAPTTAGEVRGDWRLVNASGQQFGTYVYVIINVGSAPGPTATSPAAPSDTPEPTDTPGGG
jgi:hypothetical protein